MKNTLTRAGLSIGLAYAKLTVDSVDARHSAHGVLTMISATQIQTIRVIRLCLFAAILFLTGSVMTARATTFVVTNTNDSGPGSLRNAITQANANPGADVVSFDISPRGSLKTIVVPTDLPVIQERVTINGWSQGGLGYDGPPLIELRGIGRTTSAGLIIGPGWAFQSLIRGLIINRFQVGIYISAAEVTVAGCYIGTSADGNSALPNGTGIALAFTSECRIGGPNPRERNVISGNTVGIHSNGSHNTIEGNYIGVSASGSVALGNEQVGIDVSGFGSDRIGGQIAGQRNVISGNGIGILVRNGQDNRIQGNYIGTAADGLTAMGNQVGIKIDAAIGTRIGGANDSAGNVISANGTGILLFTSSGNYIQNNLIGVGRDNSTPLGNVLDGIQIVFHADNNTIGGRARRVFAASVGNTIAFNGRSGVRVDEQSTGNLISANSIHHNLGLGIDLLPEGVTANDSCDVDAGANLLENFPVIESVTQAANGVTTITGNIFNSADLPLRLDRPLRLEFFSSRACNASGNGEGQRLIGSIIVAETAACQGQFSASFRHFLAPGEIITATATDAARNTSEFSPCFVVGRDK